MKILETERLILRRLGWQDLPALIGVLCDPYAMRFYPKPFGLEEARGWIRWSLSSYERRGYGLWAVVLKGTDLMIGDCGITVQMIDGRPEDEIGYHFQRWHWGKGYATEAARGCRDYLFDVLRKDRVVSWMTPENVPSRRVAERIGMKLEREVLHRLGMRQLVYSMSRAEDVRLKRRGRA